jgi:nicotinamidase-related amidase
VDEVLANIRRLVEACRQRGVEIIYVQHNDPPGEELSPGTHARRIHEAVGPGQGEVVFAKEHNSAFRGTGLRAYLEAKGIERLIVVGMRTEYCVDATIKVAFEYGYGLIIPDAANTTFDNGAIPGAELHAFYNRRVWAGRYGEVTDVGTVVERLLAGSSC